MVQVEGTGWRAAAALFALGAPAAGVLAMGLVAGEDELQIRPAEPRKELNDLQSARNAEVGPAKGQLKNVHVPQRLESSPRAVQVRAEHLHVP